MADLGLLAGVIHGTRELELLLRDYALDLLSLRQFEASTPRERGGENVRNLDVYVSGASLDFIRQDGDDRLHRLFASGAVEIAIVPVVRERSIGRTGSVGPDGDGNDAKTSKPHSWATERHWGLLKTRAIRAPA